MRANSAYELFQAIGRATNALAVAVRAVKMRSSRLEKCSAKKKQMFTRALAEDV